MLAEWAVVGSLEANEILKLIVDPSVRNRALLTVDLWDLAFETVEVVRDPECPACGQGHFPFLEAEHEYSAVALCGRDSIQVTPRQRARLDLKSLAERLSAVGTVSLNPFLLEADVEGNVITIFPDGRAIIKGTDDPVAAQVLYARYVGQ